MITNNLSRLDRYDYHNKRFQTAFDFLRNSDLLYGIKGFSETTPGLTTIDHHLRTRCQAAVDMVITQSTPSRIPTPFVNKIEYTPQLIVRSSTGQSPTHRSSEKI